MRSTVFRLLLNFLISRVIEINVGVFIVVVLLFGRLIEIKVFVFVVLVLFFGKLIGMKVRVFVVLVTGTTACCAI